jgi:hypothetical protein
VASSAGCGIDVVQVQSTDEAVKMDTQRQIGLPAGAWALDAAAYGMTWSPLRIASPTALLVVHAQFSKENVQQ